MAAHQHIDLGQQRQGTVVEVHLKGSEANVMLLDTTNYNNYRAQRKYSGVGLHTKKSPVRLQIPRTGRWHAVGDLGGYSGRLGMECRVLPRAA